MKNVLSILLIAIVALSSCNKEPKQLLCKEYDAQCELQKEYQFVKVLDVPDSNLIDGYGMPLIKNRWYVRSMKAKTLIPANQNPNESFSYNDFEGADGEDYSSKMQLHGKVVESDTVEIFCNTFPESTGSVHGLARVPVKLLLFGNRYIEANYNGENLRYSIWESK